MTNPNDPDDEENFSLNSTFPDINSSFIIRKTDIGFEVILKSKGRKDYNTDYKQGLHRIVSILAKKRVKIECIYLDTTTSVNLPLYEKTLDFDYPIKPWEDEIEALCHSIGLKQSNTVVDPNRKRGGNRTRRISFVLDHRLSDKGFRSQLIGDRGIIGLFNESHVDKSIIELPNGLRESDERDPKTNVPKYSDGWVYLLTNPVWEGWVKFGFSGNLKGRLSTYNTGSPHERWNYRIESYFPATKAHPDAYSIEQMIHADLEKFRSQGQRSEWYEMPITEAQAILHTYFSEDGPD